MFKQSAQVSLSWQLYASDNGERFPVTPLWECHPTVGSGLINPSWAGGILQTNATPDNTNTALLVGPTYAPFGSIGGYIKNPGVYHCPADVSVDPGNSQPRVRSISMNGWINPGKTNPPDSAYWTLPFQKFTSSTDFGHASSADIFVFTDERPASIDIYCRDFSQRLDDSNNRNRVTLVSAGSPALNPPCRKPCIQNTTQRRKVSENYSNKHYFRITS